jgi:hypothetical protein
MNCHQTHNATAQIWRPLDFDGSNEFDSAGTRSGYKLLKAFPSGSTEGTANIYGNFEPGQVIAVPESTLTAGVNYSQVQSNEETSTDPFFPVDAYTQPTWIAQHIGPEAGHEHGPDRDANAVNTMALSVWCADCHNLNIGGFEVLTNVELGFKAHTERTHPAPYSGAYNGPGQCYSCHRADLSPIPAAPAYATGFRTGCEQCHYGTASYYSEVTSVGTDFPHSADPATSIKLLGGYSVDPVAPTTPIADVITDSNLDAVCLRCHGGIGVNH